MAAKTTIRVAMINAAAKDDSFSGDSLEWLSESGSLSGSFNVLGNDPGSASLYAVSGTVPTGTGQMAPQNTSDFTVNFGGTDYTGHLTINSDGTVGFDLSSLYGKLDSLADGESVCVSFYYTAKMANGVLSTAKVSVELTGENDPPVATAESISVLEDGAVLNGQLDATDVDHNHSLSFALATGETAPDGFTLNSDGSYSFDPSNSAYQHLGAGDEAKFDVDYTVTDEHGASSTATISFTVTGVNDPATLGGDFAGAVVEDTSGSTSDSGIITISDVDDDEAHTQVINDEEGDYGFFSIDDDGNWIYELHHDLANSLQDGEKVTDTFTVTSTDGTASHSVVITITGTNDEAQFSGDDTAQITEDDAPNTVSGLLEVTDDDRDESAMQDGDIDGEYGSLHMNANGNWTYTLDNDNADVDALDDESDPLVDTITVKSLDGTEHDITITINGSTDVSAYAYVTPAVYGGLDATNDHDSDVGVGSGGSPLISGTADGETINGRTGPNGADTINANGGDDLVNAGIGGDRVYGGAGKDQINGGDGNDELYGQVGNDTIHGDGNNDTIYGGSGDDWIYGDANTDTILNGGSGNDHLFGGDGADTIIGGFGADTLAGSTDTDTFVYSDARDTGDTISDFSADDTIDLAAFAGTLDFVGALSQAGHVDAGEVGYINNGATTVIYVDTDGVYGADLEITLTGIHTLQQTDFIL